MQIAKAFFLTIKENRTVMAVYLIVFVVLEILFAQNGSVQQESIFESSQLSLVIQDQDHSTLSQGVKDYLASIHQVEKENYNQEQIADGLYYENIDYALTIPKGFGQKLIQGETTDLLENQKRKGSTSGQFVDLQIDQYLSLLQTYLTAGYTEEDAVTAAGEAANQQPEIVMRNRAKTSDKKSIYYAFSFLPYVMICILMVGLGSILISFQKQEILTRLRCSALSDWKRNIQLAICSGIFAMFFWMVLLIVAILFVGKDIFCMQGYLHIVNSFCFLLVALSLTLLVSFLVHSDDMLNMASNVIGLGLSFLGGIFVPLEMMSSSVVKLAHLLPSYWYVMAIEMIESDPGSSEQWQKLYSYFGIQVLFALAIGCAALVVSRQKKRGS